MANISDIIEEFLLETLGADERLNISRNELATYFACAPSQINYVLSTRFTPARGYSIESRRGGGGFVTVVRISRDGNELLDEILHALDEGVTYNTACQILQRLEQEDIIKGGETDIIKAAVSDKALLAPAVVKDRLRASILKAVLTEIAKKM